MTQSVGGNAWKRNSLSSTGGIALAIWSTGFSVLIIDVAQDGPPSIILPNAYWIDSKCAKIEFRISIRLANKLNFRPDRFVALRSA